MISKTIECLNKEDFDIALTSLLTTLDKYYEIMQLVVTHRISSLIATVIYKAKETSSYSAAQEGEVEIVNTPVDMKKTGNFKDFLVSEDLKK